MFDFIKNIGLAEIILLVIILIVIFGARAMVKLGRTSGETVRELKDIKKEFFKAIDDENKPSKK